ncbi:MAG: hypothetical protein QHC90_18760, partial [Shinella sp.]|nr:hypothetical protein [Shinella sp.]
MVAADRSEKRNGGRLRVLRDLAVAVSELEFTHDIAGKLLVHILGYVQCRSSLFFVSAHFAARYKWALAGGQAGCFLKLNG